METTLSACGKCERLGGMCGDCRRYCDHKSFPFGQCWCECHAPMVTRLERRSNFEKAQRFLVTSGPRKGEVISLSKTLRWDEARHAAERLARATP